MATLQGAAAAGVNTTAAASAQSARVNAQSGGYQQGAEIDGLLRCLTRIARRIASETNSTAPVEQTGAVGRNGGGNGDYNTAPLAP